MSNAVAVRAVLLPLSSSKQSGLCKAPLILIVLCNLTFDSMEWLICEMKLFHALCCLKCAATRVWRAWCHVDLPEPVSNMLIQNSFQSSVMLTNCCLCFPGHFQAGLLAGESRGACNTFLGGLTANNNPGRFDPRDLSFSQSVAASVYYKYQLLLYPFNVFYML